MLAGRLPGSPWGPKMHPEAWGPAFPSPGSGLTFKGLEQVAWGSETAAVRLSGNARFCPAPLAPRPRWAESSFAHSCIYCPKWGQLQGSRPGPRQGRPTHHPGQPLLTLLGWGRDGTALEPPELIAFIPSVTCTLDVPRRV